MRLLAIHDAQGNIARLVVRPPDSPPAAVKAGPGQFVTEIDAPEVTVDLADPDSHQRLVEVLEHFRVEVKVEGRLVRKTPSKAG